MLCFLENGFLKKHGGRFIFFSVMLLILLLGIYLMSRYKSEFTEYM